MGKKRYIKSEDIRVIKVPQYKGLTVRNIVEFAKKNIHIDRFLPEYDYFKEHNREWLCNIVNTIIPEKFQNFIKLKIEERKQLLIDSQNLGISVQPEFMNIFKSSQSISSIKRESHFLACIPKPTKDKIRMQMLEEEKKEVVAKAKDTEAELHELKLKLDDLQHDQHLVNENAEKYLNCLSWELSMKEEIQ